MSCWEETPLKRPSFSDLITKFKSHKYPTTSGHVHNKKSVPKRVQNLRTTIEARRSTSKSSKSSKSTSRDLSIGHGSIIGGNQVRPVRKGGKYIQLEGSTSSDSDESSDLSGDQIINIHQADIISTSAQEPRSRIKNFELLTSKSDLRSTL